MSDMFNVIRVRDKDARDGLVKVVGLSVYRMDTGQIEIVDQSGEWKQQ